MKIDGKNNWIYKLPRDKKFKLNLSNKIGFGVDGIVKVIYNERDDLLLIGKGFSWDGCTPKWTWIDLVFGTPEGVVSNVSGVSKTYDASLIHDALYQFAPRYHRRRFTKGFKRKEVDLLFYHHMRINDFKLAKIYYLVVRLLGWYWWNKTARRWK